MPTYFDSAKPFDNNYGRTKGFVYEGGIRVPLIASWPNTVSKLVLKPITYLLFTI